MIDPLLTERQKIYGEEVGEIFHYLLNDWADVWLTYKQYRSLFGTNEERVDLLNKHGGSFFFNVERHFWNACILGICRMTDPAEQNNRTNLTLKSLLPAISNEKLRGEIEVLVMNANTATAFARERRNKTLGHSDFDIKVKRAKIVSKASRLNMRLAIEAIHQPLKFLARELADTDIRPTVISSQPNEMGLLYSLFASDVGQKELEKQRLEKWKKSNSYDKFDPLYPYPDWLAWEDEL